jgi:hypothetical protein
MWGIVPSHDRPVGEELVRVNNLILGLDKPELELISSSESAAADFIQSPIRSFVFDQDLPRSDEIGSCKNRLTC